MLKNGQTYLKDFALFILQDSYRKILKMSLAIFQHYEWKC